jgi:hypothetical protein
MAVVMRAVIVLVKLHPHSVQAVQVVEDVEGKVILARGGMLVFVRVEGHGGVQGYLLRCDGGILVLQEFSPCGIYGWAWPAEVKWKVEVHLSVYCVACVVEEQEIVEFNRGAIVWQRTRGNCLG